MKKIALLALIFILLASSSLALYAADPAPSLSPKPSPTPVPTPTPLNTLLIQNEAYSYKITEPLNWCGFTADAAKYYVDVYLCLDKYTFQDSPAIMFVKSQKKSGYSVKQLLTWDMEDLKNRNESIQFSDFRIVDITYDYATKIYQTDVKDVNYLCYIDPGPNAQYYLIFTLKGSKEFCDKNKEAFIFMLKSFWWMY